MTRLITALTCLLIPAALAAQSGTIHYDKAVRNGSRTPARAGESPRRAPRTASVTPMLLVFSDGAVSTSVDEAEMQTRRGSGRGGDGPPAPPPPERMRRAYGSSSRADNEKVLQTYVGADGTVTEQREFLERKFLISYKRPVVAWKLTGEQSSFMKYPVQRAIAQMDSTTVEAWFAPSIPVSAGPADYSGLPGMILVLSVDSGRVVYSATAVDLEKSEAPTLSPPTDGTRVGRDEYERIVADKLKELQLERGGRGDR